MRQDPRTQPRERVDQGAVYETIKARILDGKYKGGSVLAESDLARELGVSRTPVRLALTRLETVGLVRIIPRRGVYIAELTLRRFLELFEVRRSLIQLCGRLSASRITGDELAKLSRIVDAAKAASEDDDRARLQDLDKQFHELLDASTGNTVLAGVLQNLRDQMVRIWTVVMVGNEYFRHLPTEMEEVLRALQDRDQQRCERLLSAHIDRYRTHIDQGSTVADGD